MRRMIKRGTCLKALMLSRSFNKILCTFSTLSYALLSYMSMPWSKS